jgi:acyl-coenzyme A synthetase/AMP-(fatty) acid ligase
VVCAAEYLPRQLVEWMARYHVTIFPGVPALFRVLASLPPGLAPGPLRTAISAGAILPPETAQAFRARFGIQIHNFYGSSETGGISYDRTGTASLTGRSVGRPLRGVRVVVRGGRITVASAAVATPTGKWRLPDLGEWNARRELVLLGRGGPGANISGKKVHPLEIERALRSIPGVSDALVWLEQRGGCDLLAAAAETRHSRAKLEHALAEKLPAWKMPKRYVLAPHLPRTARGKLDVARLKQVQKPSS